MGATKPVRYDADYFIRRFSAIPDEKWCTGAYRKGDAMCASGHCLLWGDHGRRESTNEWRALCDMFGRNAPSLVNDGHCPRYRQKTPRARILAALRDAKKAGR